MQKSFYMRFGQRDRWHKDRKSDYVSSQDREQDFEVEVLEPKGSKEENRLRDTMRKLKNGQT